MDEGAGPNFKVVERLDVEDEETRQARIQSFLEKLNSSSSTRTKDFARTTSPSGTHKFDFGDRTTFPVGPPSELLSRVQAFLPQLEASNSLLAQRMEVDPSSVDIEHIPEGIDQYIEMNLGLGLFEDQSKKRGEDSEMSTSSSSESSDSSGKTQEEDSDDSDYDSDESSVIITSFVPSRPVKPLPRRATNPRPQIIVLGEENS